MPDAPISSRESMFTKRAPGSRSRDVRASPPTGVGDLAHHIAEFTSHQSVESLHAGLAAAFFDLFGPTSVTICRVVGEPADLRWFTDVRLGSDATGVTGEPEVTGGPGATDDLPPLHLYPERCLALAGDPVSTVLPGIHQQVFPLLHGHGVTGTIEMNRNADLPHEMHLQAECLLRVHDNLQRLLDYGQRDTLTGLLNRKTFDDGFFRAKTAAAARVARIDADATAPRHWVGMIDVDFFKAVNDRFGHLIGDEVLLLLAQLMRSSCRNQDLLYRFGGEEFVVLLTCEQASDAAGVFERLRRNTEQHRFPQVGNVTVSIGFTEVLHGDSPASALGRADRAVYAAKKAGRNRVEYDEDSLAPDACAPALAGGEVELF